jgi:prophage regulatory protein
MIPEQATLRRIDPRLSVLPAGSWTFPVYPAIPNSTTTSAMPDYPRVHDAQGYLAISDIQRQRSERHHQPCSRVEKMPPTDVRSENPISRADDELWGLKAVVAKTGLSRSTLYAYVAIGLFPKQRRLGVRRVAWLASEVRAWIASRPQ